ncbi:MAG: IS200/IS605 family transposase [Deltaproteobacteria bacterium]|nr:IS200/IS605 family transposase [Deltaproteobacteria bacterium]
MELGKTSHSVYKIRYHMVTAVKYRKALVNSAIEDCIKDALKGISERYEILIDEVGFDRNHIHIFCGAPPRLSPLQVISIIKSITARQIFKQFPKLKKEELWGGEFWSDGKYIGTVGEAASEKTIRNYIRNQSLDKTESDSRMRQLKLFNL